MFDVPATGAAVAQYATLPASTMATSWLASCLPLLMAGSLRVGAYHITVATSQPSQGVCDVFVRWEAVG